MGIVTAIWLTALGALGASVIVGILALLAAFVASVYADLWPKTPTSPPAVIPKPCMCEVEKALERDRARMRCRSVNTLGGRW